ncbi:MAG: hypothetical protein DRO36_00885 [Candidatus Hecatellales archaeon]|nr:MAG: hypothetical protein DRO36_00885 [Candidatus Hecatellales archaeon]
MNLLEVVCSRPVVGLNDKLLSVLNILGRKGTPYRVVVLGEDFRVKGVISGRRILEVLLGRRGEALKTRKGLRGVLEEPISLFLDEARNVFPENVTLQTVLQYMAENSLGYIIVVNENHVFKGVVDEAAILGKLLNKTFGIKVKDVMSYPALTINPEASLLEASNLMVDSRVRRLLVTRDDVLVGILTITDVLHHVLVREREMESELYDVETIFKAKVDEVMNTNIISIYLEKDVGEAIDKIIGNDISCLPVSVEGKLSGVVCRIDLVSGIVKIKGVPEVVRMMGLEAKNE